MESFCLGCLSLLSLFLCLQHLLVLRPASAAHKPSVNPCAVYAVFERYLYLLIAPDLISSAKTWERRLASGWAILRSERGKAPWLGGCRRTIVLTHWLVMVRDFFCRLLSHHPVGEMKAEIIYRPRGTPLPPLPPRLTPNSVYSGFPVFQLPCVIYVKNACAWLFFFPTSALFFSFLPKFLLWPAHSQTHYFVAVFWLLFDEHYVLQFEL